MCFFFNDTSNTEIYTLCLHDALPISRRLRALTAGQPIATMQLSTDLPEVAALLPGVAGLVVTPLSSGDDFLAWYRPEVVRTRSEEHTSELQSRQYLVSRLLLEIKNTH